MDRSGVIKLIKEKQQKDNLGQYVSEETSREVFCDVRSVTRTEWFEAGRSGIKAAYIFKMFAPDYEGEKIVEFQNVRYGVYRTYLGKNEMIELMVEEMGGLSNGKKG